MAHSNKFWNTKYRELKAEIKKEMKKRGLSSQLVKTPGKAQFKDIWENTDAGHESKTAYIAKGLIYGSYTNKWTRERAWKRYMEFSKDTQYKTSEQFASNVPYSVLKDLYDDEIRVKYQEFLASGGSPKDFSKWVGFYYYGSK